LDSGRCSGCSEILKTTLPFAEGRRPEYETEWVFLGWTRLEKNKGDALTGDFANYFQY
jgi:hypothetical protein